MTETAAKVVDGHFARFRGWPHANADHEAIAEATEWLRWCLGESDLLSFADRETFYLAITEGLLPDGYEEDGFGDAAFEVLVQMARYYGAYRLTPRVLRAARECAAALLASSREMVDLARAVTDECRARYAPHWRPLSKPPEIVAPPLTRAEAATVALAYWKYRYRDECAGNPGHSERLERLIVGAACPSAVAKVQLLHDIREGYSLAKPRGRCRARLARYRRNAAAALAAAVEEYQESGRGFSGVVLEEAEWLARGTGISQERAFRYLYYLARHSRGA